MVSDDHPALLRARRRRLRWSEEDRRLYQRHRWRSEGFHGEAKTWHGLARAVRRGLQNMRIQALLTAAAINLKRLASALFLPARRYAAGQTRHPTMFLDSRGDRHLTHAGPRTENGFFNSPRVHFMRNALAHAGKQGRRVVAAFIGTAFAQDDADAARNEWRQIPTSCARGSRSWPS
jgi:hypothetical protein